MAITEGNTAGYTIPVSFPAPKKEAMPESRISCNSAVITDLSTLQYQELLVIWHRAVFHANRSEEARRLSLV